MLGGSEVSRFRLAVFPDVARSSAGCQTSSPGMSSSLCPMCCDPAPRAAEPGQRSSRLKLVAALVAFDFVIDLRLLPKPRLLTAIVGTVFLVRPVPFKLFAAIMTFRSSCHSRVIVRFQMSNIYRYLRRFDQKIGCSIKNCLRSLIQILTLSKGLRVRAAI